MRNGYRIIDADRHVMEPLELWSELLPPEFRDYAPSRGRLVDEPLVQRLERLGPKGLVPVPPRPTIGGKLLSAQMSEQAWIEFNLLAQRRIGLTTKLHEPATYLADMEQTGVDMAFLLPTYALLLEGFVPLEPEVASAYASAYNTWLHGFCRQDPQRLRGVGFISLHEPTRMVRELERVAALGWTTVVVRPNKIAGRTLGAPVYEPFWAACAERAIGVVLHSGAHSHAPLAGADRFETHYGLVACAHPLEQMMALLTLVESGVLERHPTLRVAALEAGCGWLPYWLWRLDEVHRNLHGEVEERVRMKPSEYFRRQYFATLEPDEPYLPHVIEQLGDANLMFGTDFPHPDHGPGVVDDMLAHEGRLSPEVLRKILWDNAARFFGVEDGRVAKP